MFGLNFPNRGVELHNYELDSGTKNYLYEYQNNKIKNFGDAVYYNDYYWLVFYLNSTGNDSFILKMSKTRRSIYISTTQSSLINIAFPGDNPAFVGFTPNNEPFMIQLNETTLENIWMMKITSFNSTYMSLRNSQHGSQNMLWALSDISDNKLYITCLNANDTSITWTKSYTSGVLNVSISFAPVFEEYIVLYLDTINSRN